MFALWREKIGSFVYACVCTAILSLLVTTAVPAQVATGNDPPNFYVGINAGHVGIICCAGAGVDLAYRFSNRAFELGAGFRYIQSKEPTQNNRYK